MFAPDQARRTIFRVDPNCLQTLIAGRKSRETARCLHKNLVFWLGFLEYRNTMFGQSINLVTTASDEDPKLKLIVRIGFCTAKSDIPQY